MPQRNDRIGKIEIIERLGEGSMGEVFLARDTIIGREVAIKVIRRVSLPPPDGLERFLRETQTAGRLNHPNLVTIHEFGEKAGVLFQVMDFVPGEDLITACRDPLLPAKGALELLAQVCDGLAYTHQRGILHRNLKPSNVRIGRISGRPTPKILDIGMSRVAGNDPSGTGAHLRTLAYAAPESFHTNAKLDARSDLFSVGVLLYQALTGICPFEGDTPAAIAQRILHEEPEPLDLEQFPDLSPGIQGILNQALAKDPARRFASAETLAEALRAARDPGWSPDLAPPLLAKGASSFPVQAKLQPDRPGRSHAFLAWSSALVTIAVLGGGGYWLRVRRRAVVRTPEIAAAEAPKAPQAAPVAAAPPPVPVTPPASPAPPAAPPAPPPAATPPAPAPSPAPQPKPQGSFPAHYTTLDEVEAGLPSDPQGAFAFLDPKVAAEPANERATALRIVALYGLARYSECGKAIHDAREAGHPLWAMALRQPALLKMLKQDALAPRIPRKKPAAPQTAAPAAP